MQNNQWIGYGYEVEMYCCRENVEFSRQFQLLQMMAKVARVLAYTL